MSEQELKERLLLGVVNLFESMLLLDEIEIHLN
jgi:hypothetical protein